MERLDSVGIVLYHPDTPTITTISNLLSIDLYVFVYTNSLLNENFNAKLTELEKQYSKLVVLGNFKNIGLSKSYNIICNEALSYKLFSILLLDQDTIIDIENLLIFINDNFINSFTLESNLCLNIAHGYKQKKTNIINEIFTNSGTIISLNLFSKIGYFDDRFFVELVDYEFFYRLLYNKIIFSKIFGTGIIDHVSNQGLTKRSFLFINFKIKVYPKRRIFEFYKNSYILIKDLLKRKQYLCFINFIFLFTKQTISILIHQFLWKIL
jgi:rhamnosyltransferase